MYGNEFMLKYLDRQSAPQACSRNITHRLDDIFIQTITRTTVMDNLPGWTPFTSDRDGRGELHACASPLLIEVIPTIKLKAHLSGQSEASVTSFRVAVHNNLETLSA